MSTDLISVTGLIATTPRHLTTSEGLEITSFRLASNNRRYDRGQQKWIDMDTNWFTVTAFRNLAGNSAISLQKGDRVLVRGRLRIRDWESGERSGTQVEIEAEAIGHDLTWGTSVFTRVLFEHAENEQRLDSTAEMPADWPQAESALNAVVAEEDDSLDDDDDDDENENIELEAKETAAPRKKAA